MINKHWFLNNEFVTIKRHNWFLKVANDFSKEVLFLDLPINKVVADFICLEKML